LRELGIDGRMLLRWALKIVFEFVEWIQPAQVRIQWRVILSIVTKI